MDGQLISLSYKELFGKAAPCPRTCLYFRRVEVLWKAIRANSDSPQIIRLSQYAHDTNLGPAARSMVSANHFNLFKTYGNLCVSMVVKTG